MIRYYYAGYSYMGLNYAYDALCWTAYAFPSRKERDKWVAENDYDGRQYVAEPITRGAAYTIAGLHKACARPAIDSHNQLYDANGGHDGTIIR